MASETIPTPSPSALARPPWQDAFEAWLKRTDVTFSWGTTFEAGWNAALATRAPVSGAERDAGRVEAARAIAAWAAHEFKYDGPLTDDGVVSGIERGDWRRFLPGGER